MQRREFLGKLAGVSLLAVMPSACSPVVHDASVRYVSAAKDAQGFAVFGMDESQEVRWRFGLPERAHAATISPDGSQVVVTGRRPSTKAWLLETSTGKLVRSIISDPNRHFFGHTVFDATGRYIFSTENNTENFAGLVVVRDLFDNANVVNEFSSGGVGPHELLLMPEQNQSQKTPDSTKKNMLVVANGGIKTAAGSREKLNLDTMEPNLAYIDANSGNIIQTVQPPHHQLSVRHIAVRDDGLVGIGLQFQGNKSENLPLIFTYQLGDKSLTPIEVLKNDWLVFNQYIGSVAINSETNQLCATSPRGNCIAVVNLALKDSLAEVLPLADGCGVVASGNRSNPFTLSDGFGQTTSLSDTELTRKTAHEGIKWDNHMGGFFA